MKSAWRGIAPIRTLVLTWARRLARRRLAPPPQSPIVPDASVALDEVVVTASERISAVQDTPIKISAVSG
jgi:hypothetical protein